MYLSHKASPETTQLDSDVLKLLFNWLLLTPMKNSAAKWRLKTQVRKEGYHAKRIRQIVTKY